MNFILKVVLVTLVLLMAVGANAPPALLQAMGLDPTYIKGALLAWVVVGMLVYRGIAMVVMTLLVILGANLPEDLARLWGINKTLLIITLVFIVALPLIQRWRQRR